MLERRVADQAHELEGYPRSLRQPANPSRLQIDVMASGLRDGTGDTEAGLATRKSEAISKIDTARRDAVPAITGGREAGDRPEETCEARGDLRDDERCLQFVSRRGRRRQLPRRTSDRLPIRNSGFTVARAAKRTGDERR